jgi:pseudoazurin
MKKLLLISILTINFSIYSAEHTVKMLNQGTEGYMVFEPAVLNVAVGDSVTFESTDAAHNSASMAGMIPAGAKSWNSDLSKDITVTFDVPGVYAYQCTPHSMMAMVGVIRVGNDMTNIADVKSAAEAKKASFVMNKDRLISYINQL